MKKVIALIQGASVLVSGAAAMELRHPQGIYSFMAVAYVAGLVVFLAYVYLARAAIWSSISISGNVGRHLMVPLILMKRHQKSILNRITWHYNLTSLVIPFLIPGIFHRP